jgi:hypothetical protein
VARGEAFRTVMLVCPLLGGGLPFQAINPATRL